MAGYDFEFYETGTISVTAGQKAFTGTGTAWKLRGCEGALVVVAGAGAVNFVSSLSTDAAGEFRTAWAGPTLADASYVMWLPSAVAATALANHQRLAEIIAGIQGAQPESAILSAFAALQGADGKLPMFTGENTLELVEYIADAKGSLKKLAALTLAARQVLQTDATGALKQIALVANKAIVTDADGDVVPIDIGSLGRTLLALATGTSAQYVQGDGTLQAKAGLPVNTATQTALNAKANLAGGNTIDGFQVFNSGLNLKGLVDCRRLWTNQDQWQMALGWNNGSGQGEHFKIWMFNNTSLQIAGYKWDGSFGGAPLTLTPTGNVYVGGALSKASGTFLIDHPLDPYNRNLRHGFVEAPRYDLIYRGTVQLVGGRASVDIDAASNMTSGTFAALTSNAVVISLQNQEGFARLKPGAINGGSFEIICEDEACTDLVSWVVIAERHDPFVKSDLDPNTDSYGRFVPEFEKEDA